MCDVEMNNPLYRVQPVEGGKQLGTLPETKQEALYHKKYNGQVEKMNRNVNLGTKQGDKPNMGQTLQNLSPCESYQIKIDS